MKGDWKGPTYVWHVQKSIWNFPKDHTIQKKGYGTTKFSFPSKSLITTFSRSQNTFSTMFINFIPWNVLFFSIQNRVQNHRCKQINSPLVPWSAFLYLQSSLIQCWNILHRITDILLSYFDKFTWNCRPLVLHSSAFTDITLMVSLYLAISCSWANGKMTKAAV